MPALTRAGALVAAASAALLTVPAAAHATPRADGPGDNGTVKIHDATTGEELRKNEPRVCTFYLDAFGFDSVQQVDWHIEAWAPTAATKGATVKSGELTLDAEGHGRSEDLSLPDGHYKLFWNFDGEHGSAKHKVFWTDCEDEENGGGGTPSATPSASASASATTGAEPTASASTTAGAEASASPSTQGDSGDLAETGSSAPVGLLSAAAAALVAAGGYLLFRRRAAGRG